jgi:hypothetical protein
VDLVDRVIAEVKPERISKKDEKLIKFNFYQKPDSNKNRINISKKIVKIYFYFLPKGLKGSEA